VPIRPEIRDWLLDSDPALRWQVQRDLLAEPPEVWRATRARVATEGWGAELLSRQDADGQWAGGAYFPAGHFDGDGAREPGQPWTATTWVLKDLREWGLDAGALAGTAGRLAANSRWEYDDLPYWGGEIDVCINAFTLATGGWLGADVRVLRDWLPAHQLADGGWNCEAEEGRSTRGSFHSTLNAIRGLLDFERIAGDTRVRSSRHAGEEYLLRRQLMYRESTGEPVGDFVGWFAHPNRWRYSALDALDHFRSAALHDGVAPDPRLADAIDLVRAARQHDGTWLQGEPPEGRAWVEVDAQTGERSKWLTLIGTRVLDWWDAPTR